ncbi:MAG: hypothetical protein MH132_02225 [Hydrotalea sp.]|nr:hypothetical protein [Hydrotalea sp.]
MASNFDKNFETHKATFKQKFGKDWNADPQLYLTYLNTLYISSLTEIANNGLGQILSRQEESHKLLQYISQKLK